MLQRILWITFGAFFWVALAWATKSGISPEDQVRKIVKEHFPAVPLDELTVAPLAGLYQVTSGGLVFYLSMDGHYLFSGEILDLTANKKNVTESARQTARVSLLSKIDPESYVVFAPKEPQYTVTVFTDFDCGYCKQLHGQIPALNKMGIAVRYAAFPREGKGSVGFQKAEQVWCAADKKRAFQEMEKQGKVSGDLTVCKSPVENYLKMGVSMGVSGTPTIILNDGTLIPGFVPPDKLLELVKAAGK